MNTVSRTIWLPNNKTSKYLDVLGHTEYMSASFTDFVYPRHVHETFAIGVIEEGAQHFVSRKGSETMPARQLCVIDPDIVHEGWKGVPSGWRYRMFYPSIEVVARALDVSHSQAEKLGFGRFVIDDRALFAMFRKLHILAMNGAETLATEELAISFIGTLFSHYAGHRAPNVAPHRVADICKEYLDGHARQRVSVRQLAELSGVSETQVIRDFTRRVGMSPYAFQIARRIEKAKTLLSQGVPPAETALECGFVDQSHLTRHFRRLVGVPPGRFARLATHG